MIVYFSGTGNSRWAARRLAELTGERTWDITGGEPTPALQDEARIGLVFPIYAWGVPKPMRDFVQRLTVRAPYTFAVCTCGEEAGLAMKKLAARLPLDAALSLVMPNNYVAGAELEDEPTVRRKLAQADERIEAFARQVLAGERVYRVEEGPLAALKSGPVNFGFNRFAVSTRAFWVTDACVRCGRCAKDCPAGAIALENGRPVWSGQCFQCMRCINACPQQAIQYGKGTAGRKRYTIERYLKETGKEL